MDASVGAERTAAGPFRIGCSIQGTVEEPATGGRPGTRDDCRKSVVAGLGRRRRRGAHQKFRRWQILRISRCTRRGFANARSLGRQPSICRQGFRFVRKIVPQHGRQPQRLLSDAIFSRPAALAGRNCRSLARGYLGGRLFGRRRSRNLPPRHTTHATVSPRHAGQHRLSRRLSGRPVTTGRLFR